MAIEIPFADIHTLKELVGTLKSQNNHLRTLMEDPNNGVSAIRHTFLPDTLAQEEAIHHPWVEGEDNSQPLNDCIDATQAIWFDDTRIDPRRTRAFPAVVIANQPVLDHVKAINNTKDDLKKAITSIKKRHRSLTDDDIATHIDFDRDGLNRANEAVKQTMHKAGVARLCVKQAYRHIPVHDEPLLKAKYYFAPKRPSRKRTVSDQITLFRTKQQRGDTSPELAVAIEILHTLPMDLVISERQAVTHIITANIKIGNDAKAGRWVQSTAVMPIFFGEVKGELNDAVDFSRLNIPPSAEPQPAKRKTVWAESPFIPHYRLHLPADYVV